jgi:hypothetical protein
MDLQDQRVRVIAFGTGEPAPVRRRVTAGALSVEFSQGMVRGLSWRGVEVVRAIDCSIRDQNWATCPAEITDQQVTAGAHEFSYTQRRVVAGGALTCRLIFTGCAAGVFHAAVELTAHQDFSTNRAGFTILHPLDGLTGLSFTIFRRDGSTVPGQFPLLISPGQVALDIAGLAYTTRGVGTKIDFKGEIFEMEDQRNWSDASFKTYCRPLSRPVPYMILAGEIIRQEIEIHLRNALPPASGTPRDENASASSLRMETIGERVPTMALAMDSMSMPDLGETSIAHLLAPRVLQLRVDLHSVDAILSSAQQLAGSENPELELEIVIPTDCGLDECLAEMAARCKQNSLRIARVLALPEAYLRNYQPQGPWPDGPTPQETCVAARRWFPDSQIGGGVLTHFVELNRCRPDVTGCDYLSHGSTAILHAADDCAVIDTLEGLSHVYASARALAHGHDYRLGLVSIGMRSNPHGTDVTPNPAQLRLPMACIDPRQRGLFAAAWAVGAVAATAGHRVSSMAIASAVGPFGLIYRRASWPQPLYDELPNAAVYPLFHVFRALLQLAGAPRLAIRSVPPGVVGVAAQIGANGRLIVANVSEGQRHLKLPRDAYVQRLDQNTFQAAICDPNWLGSSPAERCSHISLDAYDVAFADLRKAAA